MTARKWPLQLKKSLSFVFLILKTITIFHWHGIALGELCLLGQKETTTPFGLIWPQLWPFI